MYRLILKLIGSWLAVVCWWELYLLDDFQPYRPVVAQSLLWLVPLALLLLVMSVWYRRDIKGHGARAVPRPPEGQKPSGGLSEAVIGFRILDFGFRIAGLVITISLALLLASACISLTSGYPTFCSSFLSSQVSFVLNLVGFNSGVTGGTVLLEGKRVLLDPIKVGLWQILAFMFVFSGLVFGAYSTKVSAIREAYPPAGLVNRLPLIILGVICHYLYLIVYAACMVVFIPKEMLPGMELFGAFWGMKMWLGVLPILPLWFWLMSLQLPEAEGESSAASTTPAMGRRSAAGATPFSLPCLILLTAFSISMSCFFFGFNHKEKETVILVDEIHSRWESTLREFNRQEFGMMAENNYYKFLEYIAHFHKTYVVTDGNQNSSVKGVTTLHEKELSQKLFDSFQDKRVILILKCFTRYPTDKEVNTTVQFVKNGGNILFIGDHTDVFFMDTYINKVSKRFGIEFVPNAVYVATGGWPVTDRRNMRYHPVTQYMDRFVWATSDVLELSGNAFPLIFSPISSYTDKANYYNNYFFGDTMFRPDNSLGIHAIMAAAEYGRGRIVAWSDSTCFNNELLFTVDRRGLLSGIFSWFSHSGYINPFSVIAIVLLMMLAWHVLRFRQKITLLLVLWLPVGIVAGWLTAIGLNNILYPPPKPQVLPEAEGERFAASLLPVLPPLPSRILFDESHQPEHPLTVGNMDQMLGEDSYERFFYHLGRCKYYPEVNYRHRLTKARLTAAPDRGAVSVRDDTHGNSALTADNRQPTTCLIIPTPRSSFSRDETEGITAFVKNGGGLLLIEGAGFDKTTASGAVSASGAVLQPIGASSINQVAHLFGLHFRRDPHTLDLGNTFLVNPTYVEGGRILLSHQGIPIISCVRYGKGLVLALGDSGMFSNKGIGLYTEGFVWMMNDMMEALGGGDEEALKGLDWQMLVRGW